MNTNLHVFLGAGPAGTAIAAELADRGLTVRHVARSAITGAPVRDDLRHLSHPAA